MAIIFSEFSFDYASVNTANNEISLFVNRTAENGSGTNSQLVVRGNAVPQPHRDKFEIRVIPSGDTSRIIRNDFGAGFTPMTSFKRLTHRVERDTASGSGTTSGGVSLEVTVRRIAFPSEQYVRTVAMNNSITANVQTSNWDGQIPLNTFYTDTGFLDGRNAEALVELLFQPAGGIRVRRNYPFSDVLAGLWSGNVANSSNSEIRITHISGMPPTTNTASNWVQLNLQRVLNYAAPPPSGDREGTVRVEIREIGNPATTVSMDIYIVVSLQDQSGPGGPGGEGSIG